ncbi:DsbA family oxidoreductase [Ornithinimicrobium avium]|uniref:DsbA family oxidoreductase n=1 Tax=Ornithinimicrobium avium TaxID=2283195 RepID=A0A345NL39_9MICO|nr:DsbA family oxidoreductase [Ornithinimicrobium avium]AXH95747.1 DsbA family oxidoreductase [Ornithinimicrobium avium]
MATAHVGRRLSSHVLGRGPAPGGTNIACPWCRIAKRRFEEAAAQHDRPVTVEYHSFELAPDLPDDYVGTEAEFLRRLYPGTKAAGADLRRIRQVVSTGARLGLDYDFDAVRHTSTFLAHQLLHHGKAHGVQGLVLDALFTAYFEHGHELRQVDGLVALGADVGLDAAVTREALLSGRYADAVRQDRARAGDRGVTSIPTYVLPGQDPIHGALRPVVFLDALRMVP